ncbi:N-acetyltransferase [Hafnia alvei]|uniref:N-acetyltransferase n=1 Tax=Hafnia alvei TaxID=569 RepID=UPI000B6F3C42|nr:N-acetyltransferase [Hafnia alvei]MBI0276223.1 N-acetyltransferase [Hafnia alvei]PNK97127.1 N-acetyltransferase [Hafnia alvei]
MNRPAVKQDMPAIMALWLVSTTEAHPFISAQYWRESEAVVRDTYLPNALTWVAEDKGEIIGFISVLEQQFIGALFVEKSYHGKGIGQLLMMHVKMIFPQLMLEVYLENHRALRFYQREGFQTQDTQFNEDTQHKTAIMLWEKTPGAWLED